MRVDGITLFCEVVSSHDELRRGTIVFFTERYPVPIFGSLVITVSPTTLYQRRGKILAFQEVVEALQGYVLRPGPVPKDPRARVLKDILEDPFLEGLWIRVWGNLGAEGTEEVLVEPGHLPARTGDQDPRITGLKGWTFGVKASVLELDPELMFESPE